MRKMSSAGRALVLALLTATGVPALQAQPSESPQNVILFISDGCGPASFTLAREYKRYKGEGVLAVDRHLVGSISTYASDSRVTDSAASGTAMACGVKTNNGAIAVDTAGQPVATILEAAEARGMATGLVVTSTISHATPATFSSHVSSRGDQPEIARQQLEQGIEVLFGGGSVFYLPEAEGGARNDAVNLFDLAAEKGYHIAHNRGEFLAISEVPALGIFARDQMAFEIDRDKSLEPSLAEMTEKALDLLDQDPTGFFLMVEGSRIDHAGHANDAAAHLSEILEYDAAFDLAIQYAAEQGNTLVVATSDHETGGLSLGRSIDGRPFYEWSPEVLDRIPSSLGVLIQTAADEGTNLCEFLDREAAVTCSPEDSLYIQQADSLTSWELQRFAGAVVSKAARIGWTSSGHTAVDVNLYAYGPGAEAFRSHHDNTGVATTIAEVMGFDLPALTEQIRSSSP